MFSCASRGPGKKLVCVPEVWRWCNDETMPMEFAELSQAGRELGIELVCDTQHPERLNSSLVGNCTEIVIFRLLAKESVRAVKDILSLAGIEADAAGLCQQPMGSFVGFNRQSGASLSGRFVF